MRKLGSFIIVVVVGVLAVWTFFPEWLPGSQVITNIDTYQAAQYMQHALSQTEQKTTFRLKDDRIDREQMYHALEAIWPYAFSLSTTTYQNGMMDASVQVENAAAQQQAQILAQGIVAQLITPDMSLETRLRTLHDYVVRGCIYDEDTAARETLEEGSGADAPFTAAGALVNGKAVCAGYARALMMLCDAAGIDMLYIADAGMNHSWNAVRYYGEVRYIDSTFDDPIPDRGERVSDSYFLLTAQQLQQTHTWDEAFYNALIDKALPAQLGTAQRLYDLHLLATAPRAKDIAQPLRQADRQRLEQYSGFAFAQEETLGGACDKVWQAIDDGRLAKKLLTQGVYDGKRAVEVGISRQAFAKNNANG